MKVLLEIVRSSNPHRRHISLTVILAFEHKLVMSGLQQKGGWNKNVLRRSREVCPYETFSVWLRKKREREHSSTEERVCEASCVCVCVCLWFWLGNSRSMQEVWAERGCCLGVCEASALVINNNDGVISVRTEEGQRRAAFYLMISFMSVA